jgi:hypothetical protein
VITNTIVSFNQIIGGSGGGPNSNGGAGGDALGGGIFQANGSLTITSSTITLNDSVGGLFRAPGQSAGGGLYVAGGAVSLDQATFAAIVNNSATNNPDIFEPFTIC